MTPRRVRPTDVDGYRAWIARTSAPGTSDTGDAGIPGPLAAQGLLLSVLMLPNRLAGSAAIRRSWDSLGRQSYPLWEAWSADPPARGDLDERVHVLAAEPGETGTRWVARAIEHANGEYLIPLRGAALLAPDALQQLTVAIGMAEPPDLVYSDEDLLDEEGARLAPHFKPSWDPELMLGRDVVGSLSAFRTVRVRSVGGVDPAAPSTAACLYELALRVAATGEPGLVRHVPQVLCSLPIEGREAWLMDGSAARAIVEAHLARADSARGAEVLPVERAPAWVRVAWPLPSPPPRVSVIVPTRDQPALLARCARGVLDSSDAHDVELIIVDNGSSTTVMQVLLADLATDPRVHVVRDDGDFDFSRLNNLAARHASGDVLILLNDDTEPLGSGWLRELASQALRPEIGIVGARLLYPDGRLQHAGIILQDGSPHHQFRLSDAAEPGPSGELLLVRSVSAVTAACVALRRSVYEEVGGLDEGMAVAFGDVDLCLRIAERGYRVICTPFAELIHHKSTSRGYEDSPAKRERMGRELELLRARWGPLLAVDRFANPNLSYTWDEAGSWGLPVTGRHHPRLTAARRAVEDRLPSVVLRAVHWLRAKCTPPLPNPLFSAEWYLASYPDVGSYRLGAYWHYRRHGARQGRNPNGHFDARWYLERYPDVAAKGTNPLDHYLRHGAAEGRDPGPGFSTAAYLAAHPDLRRSGENPLLHHLRRGGAWRPAPR